MKASFMFKLAAVLLVIFILAIVGFAISIPSIISSKWGHEKLINIVNKKIPGKFEIESIKVSLKDGISIENLQLLDEEGKKIMGLKRLSSEASIFDILKKKIGKLEVLEPSFNIDVSGSGEINLHKALIKSKKKKSRKKGVSAIALLLISALEVKNGNISFTYQDDKAIAFDKIYASLQTSRNSASLKIKSETRDGDAPGEISIEGNIRSLNFLKEWKYESIKNAKLDLAVQLVNLPLKGIDQIVSLVQEKNGIKLSETIGKNLNLNLKSKISQNDLSLALNANAKNLKVDFLGKTDNGKFELTSPGNVKFNLTPLLAKKFSPFLKLQEDSLCEFALQKATIPLSDMQNAEMQANLNIKQLIFNLPKSKNIVVRKLNINLDGPILDKTSLKLNLELGQDLQNLGSDVSIDFSSALSLLKGEIVKSGELILKSKLLQTSLKGIKIDKKGIAIEKPLYGEYLIKKEKLNGFIKENLALKINVEPFTTKFQNFASTIVEGVISTEDFAVGRSSSIQNTNVYFDINKKANAAHMELSTQVSSQSDAGTLVVLATLSDFLESKKLNLQNAKLKGEVKSVNLPISAIEDYVELEDQVAPLFGELLNLNGNFYCPSISKINTCKASLDGRTPLLQLNSKMDIVDGNLITDNTKIAWDITPKGFDKIRDLLSPKNRRQIRLERASNLKAEITSLTAPINKLNRENWPKLIALKMNTLLNELALKGEHGQGTTLLENISSSISTESLASEIFFSAKGRLNEYQYKSPPHFQSKQDGNPGFVVTGFLKDLFNEENEFSLSTISTKVNASITKLPTQDLIYLLISNRDTQDQFFAILGEEINANMSAELEQMEGEINAEVVASNSMASIFGDIQDNNFFLSKPLRAQLFVTPELGESLKNINPILSSPISSDRPITLTVDPSGFNIPIFPFIMEGVNVRQARVDLDKILLKNEGLLKTLINFCHSNAKDNRVEKDRIYAWFTPLIAKCDEGIASYSRIDALLDDIHIASWGKVDLVQKNCDMMIGVAADTLKTMFGIENIADNYVLKIPVIGPLSKPKLDTQRALLRLGTLEARQAGGGGFIIGEFIDIITSKAKNESPVPPPLVKPFPWEEEQ